MAVYVWLCLLTSCTFLLVSAHEGHDHGHAEQQLSSSTDKLVFTVYYESLCPDSIKFFGEQLEPTYKKLEKYMDVMLVPYGKSKQWYTNNYSFECHHGSNECYGNIVQACALNKYYDRKSQINFIFCLMKTVDTKTNTNATYPGKKCAEEYQLEYDHLSSCVSGDDGLRYLSELGNKTAALKPPLKSVPSVAVNNHFDYNEQSELLSNFKSAVCTRLKSAKKTNLQECNGASTLVVTTSVLLMSLMPALATII